MLQIKRLGAHMVTLITETNQWSKRSATEIWYASSILHAISRTGGSTWPGALMCIILITLPAPQLAKFQTFKFFITVTVQSCTGICLVHLYYFVFVCNTWRAGSSGAVHRIRNQKMRKVLNLYIFRLIFNLRYHKIFIISRSKWVFCKVVGEASMADQMCSH